MAINAKNAGLAAATASTWLEAATPRPRVVVPAAVFTIGGASFGTTAATGTAGLFAGRSATADSSGWPGPLDWVNATTSLALLIALAGDGADGLTNEGTGTTPGVAVPAIAGTVAAGAGPTGAAPDALATAGAAGAFVGMTAGPGTTA